MQSAIMESMDKVLEFATFVCNRHSGTIGKCVGIDELCLQSAVAAVMQKTWNCEVPYQNGIAQFMDK